MNAVTRSLLINCSCYDNTPSAERLLCSLERDLYHSLIPATVSSCMIMTVVRATFTGFDPYKLTGVSDRSRAGTWLLCHCTRTGVHGTEMCWQEDS